LGIPPRGVYTFRLYFKKRGNSPSKPSQIITLGLELIFAIELFIVDKKGNL